MAVVLEKHREEAAGSRAKARIGRATQGMVRSLYYMVGM